MSEMWGSTSSICTRAEVFYIHTATRWEASNGELQRSKSQHKCNKTQLGIVRTRHLMEAEQHIKSSKNV